MLKVVHSLIYVVFAHGSYKGESTAITDDQGVEMRALHVMRSVLHLPPEGNFLNVAFYWIPINTSYTNQANKTVSGIVLSCAIVYICSYYYCRPDHANILFL